MIKHIGVTRAICKKKFVPANLREDLGYERYKGLGIVEKFEGDKPYRICKNCLKVIQKRENR